MSSPALAEKTLEEEIAEAIEEVNAKDAPVEETSEPEAKDEQLRAEDGKFAPKDETPKEQKAVETETPAEQPVIPDKYGIPPNYAKKAIRENWANLPPEIRQELHERESEFHKQLTRFDEERNFGKQVKQVVAPYENYITSLGANPVQAFDYLIKTDYALRTAPPEQRKAMFIQAARDYGIDISAEMQSSANVPSDPRVETLAQRLERLEREQQSAIQQKQLQEQQTLERQIEDFASRPENVYFDRVSPMMAALLQSGQADSLEKAYEMAVFADPETRALQLAAQQQAQQSQRSQTSTAAAQRAKAASVSVTGAPGIAVPASSPTSAGSLEDDIRAAIAAASGRI